MKRRGTLVRLFLLPGLALLPAARAAAQEVDDVLPALRDPAPAPHPGAPAGSAARATVELTLEVAGDGRVLDAQVLGRGETPLDRAALAAARSLRFSPGRSGRRAGGFSAIVAYTFEAGRPGVARLVSVFFPQAVSISGTAPAGERPPAAVRISAEDARQVPGTQGDVGKVIESLPGVARPGLGSGDLVLWGAAPGESRVLVDGMEIPALLHLGGLRSVLPAALLAGVEVIPGAYGVAHGRGVGGLVRVETADLPAGWHGGASLDPLDATVHLGAGRGPVKVGAAWREGLLHRVLDGGVAGRAGGLLALPAFRDQQIKASVALNEEEEVQALLLASRDRLQRGVASADPADARREAVERQFQRLALRYRRHAGARETAEAIAWIGSDASARDLQFGPVPARLEVETRSFGLHASVRERLGDRTAVVLGLDALVARSRLARAGSLTVPAREGDPAVFGQPPGDDVNADAWRATSIGMAPFASAELTLGRLSGSAGLRFEALGLEVSRMTPRVGATPAVGHRQLTWAPDPRLGLRWAVLPWIQVSLRGGRYHQLPVPEDLSAVFGTPRLGPARADHAALSASARAGGWLTTEVTAFAKRLAGLPARDPSVTPPLARVLTDRGRGRSAGLQLLARWNLDLGLTGWLAYTLSRSERCDGPERAFRLADFDQTHVLAAVVGLHRGPWSFGSRGRWVTGAPRTPVVAAVYDARADRHAPLFGSVNATRLPPFFQVDLRAERTFSPGRTSLDVYLELLNVTARRNAEELAYNHDYSASAPISGLPLLAVGGARLRF